MEGGGHIPILSSQMPTNRQILSEEDPANDISTIQQRGSTRCTGDRQPFGAAASSTPLVASWKEQKGRNLVERNSNMFGFRKARRRTFVHGRQVLERGEEEHEDDTHAEDLDAATGHVEHECLHGEGLCGCDGVLPCSFLFQLVIRSRRLF